MRQQSGHSYSPLRVNRYHDIEVYRETTNPNEYPVKSIEQVKDSLCSAVASFCMGTLDYAIPRDPQPMNKFSTRNRSYYYYKLVYSLT